MNTLEKEVIFLDKNKTLIIGGVLLVIVLGFAGFAYFKSMKSPETKMPTPLVGEGTIKKDESPSMADKIMGKGSVLDMLNLGKNLKCTIKAVVDEGQPMESTMYMAGNKIRSDYVGKVDTGEGMMDFDSHMIMIDKVAYVWSSMSPTGTKMDMTDLMDPTSPDGTPAERPAYAEFDQDVDYDCDPWLIVDNSKFDLPEGVEFMDITESMLKFNEEALPGDVIDDPCAACETLDSDEAIVACQEQLGCNQ